MLKSQYRHENQRRPIWTIYDVAAKHGPKYGTLPTRQGHSRRHVIPVARVERVIDQFWERMVIRASQ